MKQNCSSEKTQAARLAAIVNTTSQLADLVLHNLVEDLREAGLRPAGLLQRHQTADTTGCGLQLENLRHGTLHRVTQELGAGSVSCNIDTNAMARLGMALIEELNDETDILIINRFGKRESETAGFCHVIEYAAMKNVPVLTVVSENFVSSWFDYGGDLVTTLPCTATAVNAWCQQIFDFPRHSLLRDTTACQVYAS